MSVFSTSTPKDRFPATSLSCSYTPRLVAYLKSLNISLVLTSAQSGRVLCIGAGPKELVMSVVDFDQPHGVAASTDKIALSLNQQLQLFVSEDRPERPLSMNPLSLTRERHEFSSNQSRYTAGLSSPDLAWGTDGLWFANPAFCGLSTLTNDGRLMNLWKPAFVSELAEEDHWHINGVAVENGVPRYVTAMAESKAAGGKRVRVLNRGVIVNVPSGEVVCRGLFSPAAPRVHNGSLWVLQANSGQLCHVHRRTGVAHVVETFPGYTTGFDCHDGFGFVGLSSSCGDSESAVMPLSAREKLWCGLAVVNLTTGKVVEALKLLTGFECISSVAVVPGRMPTLI